MTTLVDYFDRTIDLTAFDGMTAQGEQQLTMRLAAPGEGGQVCTGAQKVVQRFLLKLLTELGSDPLEPEDGTEFLTKLNRGEIRNQVDALVVFAEAQLDIRRRLRAEETAADPADERYESAVVESLAVLPGFVQYHLRITTRAGDARQVILPLPITVR